MSGCGKGGKGLGKGGALVHPYSVLGGCQGLMKGIALRLARRGFHAVTFDMRGVASLLHDDILDDADTRRGIGSLNFVMGNKLAVLAGDFLLSRACVALASLNNTEVVSLLATAVEHLVTGETMQMTITSEQRCSMEYYLQKTYCKTASLISKSCKAIALLAGQTTEVSMLAYEYGKNLGLAFQLIDDILDFTGTSTSLGKGSLSDIRHVLYISSTHEKCSIFCKEKNLQFSSFRKKMVIVVIEKVVVEGWRQRGMVLVVMMVASGVVVVEMWVRCCGGEVVGHGGGEVVAVVVELVGIITAPILYAMEEFPQLRAVVDRGFRNPADVDLALDYLGKSRGIQRTRELAAKHATLASAAIDSLPESDDEDVRKSRRALVDLTHRVITRTK
ncbi:hypothetical protein RHMOL_Rhmol05G0266400 [Rhododendron molle]|uniref:Uncharacterized protein n=1 Tax=Rhododendron molle TaxID=49168 RepID=A0ACC0NTH0_RHOML|nr:hypothetical protein RHMOL_Rhmol05G0266400 [Rhododendron molle]